MPGHHVDVPPLEDLRRVGERVRKRRIAMGLDQSDLQTRVKQGPSRETVGLLERGRGWPKTEAKRVAFSRALTWDGDALTDLLDGREPTEAPAPAPPVTPQLRAGLIRLRDQVDDILRDLDEVPRR